MKIGYELFLNLKIQIKIGCFYINTNQTKTSHLSLQEKNNTTYKTC